MAMCGGKCVCPNAGVLRTSYNQLTGNLRTDLLSSAIIYSAAPHRRTFTSNTEYTAFKKARLIAGSKNGPGPVPSVIVTDLQNIGCS